MKKLSSSGLGIVVDKSRATKTFPTKTTAFLPRYRSSVGVQTLQEDQGGRLGALTALALLFIYYLVILLGIYAGKPGFF